MALGMELKTHDPVDLLMIVVRYEVPRAGEAATIYVKGPYTFAVSPKKLVSDELGRHLKRAEVEQGVFAESASIRDTYRLFVTPEQVEEGLGAAKALLHAYATREVARRKRDLSHAEDFEALLTEAGPQVSDIRGTR